jgi:hypothetical protein
MPLLRPCLGRRDRDLLVEIRAHIHLEAADNIERGMAPEEARRAAASATWAPFANRCAREGQVPRDSCSRFSRAW